MRPRSLGALCALALVFALPAGAGAAPSLPLGHSGRWITDSRGRVVVMHGTNMVYKLAPYYPAAGPFGDSDAAYLNSIGFTAVRVGIIWKALEPQPGVYDDNYLNHIAATVRMLARHGIVSILDFHQDMYNEKYQGEGFPDWSVYDDGLPNQPHAGFPTNYFVNPALQRAFENFWADKPGPGGVGLQERYAATWRHVAQRFHGNNSVLGYEIMNEPFPGSDYTSCGAPSGCSASDAELTGLNRKVDHAIRSADSRTLVFYEPYVSFNFGFDDHVGALNDPRAVFAWHDYCLSNEAAGCNSHAATMTNAASHVARSGEGSFMTEFGATTSTGDLDQMISLADQNRVPWTEWSYCTCGDPTGASDEGIVLDPTKPKTESNLRPSIANSIVEPYPQLVAGTPRSWGFSRASRTFSLTFATGKASGRGSFRAGALSEIAAPARSYPSGYRVQVRGGAVVSPPRSGVLRVVTCPRAKNVTVTLSPGSGISQSCRLRLHIRVRPHRARPGQTTTYRFTVIATLGSYSVRIAGARISFAGRTVRTGRHGRAKIRVNLPTRRRYTATARARGYKSGRIKIRARQ